MKRWAYLLVLLCAVSAWAQTGWDTRTRPLYITGSEGGKSLALEDSIIVNDGARFTGNVNAPNIGDILADNPLALPDSTLATNASGKKIIVGDLTDPAVMWDLAAFRAAERNTGHYKTVGARPTRYAWTITTGQYSAVLWNRDDMTRYAVFIKAASNLIGNSAITDVSDLDGVTRFATAAGLVEFDWASDKAVLFSTTGISAYIDTSNFNNRNGAKGYLVLSTSPAIVNAAVGAVVAVRDPSGLKMQGGSGRPAQWWTVGTDGGASTYNPWTNAILDNADTDDNDAAAADARGGWYAFEDGATQDGLRYSRTVCDVTADSWTDDEVWINSGSGSEDLAWGNAAIFQGVAVVPGRSAAGTNAAAILVGSDSGLVYLHAKANDNTRGGQVLIEDGFNAPYAVGSAVGVYPLDGNALDVSPYANSLTAVGTPGYAAAVFGTGYSSTSDSYLKRDGDSDYNVPRSVSVWFKSASATNPSAVASLVDLGDLRGTGAAEVFYISINTSGYLVGETRGAGVPDIITGATDVYDANWHHTVATYNSSATQPTSFDVYLDGELHVQDASLAATVELVTPDSLTIGANNSGGGTRTLFFDGLIDHVAISKNILTPLEIRAMYADGLRAIQSTVDPSDAICSTDIDYVDAWDDWALAGDEDSLTVFQVGGTTLIPWKRYGSPGGNIQDAALIPIPGADSIGVAMVTTTRVQFVQPDPQVASYASYQWPYVQPFVGEVAVVDSAGAVGVFWHGDDAVDAAANAKVGRVAFRQGTYPSFNADQQGMFISGAGRRTIIDGATTDDAIDASAADVTISDLAVQTTAGGGNAFDGIEVSARVNIHNVIGIASDNVFINITGTGDDSKITDSRNISSDAQGVLIDIDAENCIVDGNRLDGWGTAGITDNSGTSTSGDNDVD